jgi:hypothetical protein
MKINIPTGFFLETERPSGFFLCLSWCSDRPFFFSGPFFLETDLRTRRKKVHGECPFIRTSFFKGRCIVLGFPQGLPDHHKNHES